MHQTPDFGTPTAALVFLRANPDYIPTDADLVAAEAEYVRAATAAEAEYDRVRAPARAEYDRVRAGALWRAVVAWDVANALLSLVNARRNRTTRTMRFQ